MAVTLTKPVIGSTDWGTDVNNNWQAIEDAFKGTQTIGPLNFDDGSGKYLRLPRLTTVERDALTPVNGMMIYNTTTTQFERHENGSWGAFGSGSVTGVTASSPLQSSGGTTPDISFLNQNANLVLAGPTSGPAAAPTFRALVEADIGANTVNGAAIKAGAVDLTTKVTNTLPVGNGGTGLSTVASGALLYASALDTLAALAIGASGTYLRSNGSAPAWSSIPAADLPNHATSHKNGGSDEVATATPGANEIPKAGASGKLDKDWCPDFVASGASHAKGAVPDPGVTAGTTKFLREDATWAVPAGGGGSPAGSNGEIQFNSSGSFGADSNLFWDNTNKRLGVGTSSPAVDLHVAGEIRFKREVEAKTSNYTVTVDESGKVFTNSGAAGAITFTLPAAAAGLQYTFVVIASKLLQIQPAGGDAIRLASGSVSSNPASSIAVYSSVTLIAVDAVNWIAVAQVGVWGM